jgi:hypothetical protein
MALKDAIEALVREWDRKAIRLREDAERYHNVEERERARVLDRAWLEVQTCADQLRTEMTRHE